MSNTGFTADLAFYNQIFNLTKIPVFIKDLHSRFVHVNNAFCNIYCLSHEEVIGNTETDFQKTGKCKILRTSKSIILDPGIPKEFTNYEILIIASSARFRVSQYILRAIKNEIFIFGSYENITERMVIQRKLKESEVLYKALVNNSPNLIVIHINNKIVFANDASASMTGYQPNEVVGKNLITLLKITEFKQEGMMIHQPLLTSIYPGEYMAVQAEVRNRQRRYFLLKSTQIIYKKKNAVMSILFDLTDRVELETSIVSKVIETEENDRKIFAADLHDDLGPLLSSVKLYLGFTDPASPEGVESKDVCMELIDEAINKISSVANNLMPRLIESYGLESALFSLCRQKSKTSGFRAELISDLGTFRFRKETELHLYRITSELLNNSLKHSGGNRAFIWLINYNGTLLLTYSDNGKGYDIAELLKNPKGTGITNIFYRVQLIHGDIEFNKKNEQVEVNISVKINEE